MNMSEITRYIMNDEGCVDIHVGKGRNEKYGNEAWDFYHIGITKSFEMNIKKFNVRLIKKRKVKEKFPLVHITGEIIDAISTFFTSHYVPSPNSYILVMLFSILFHFSVTNKLSHVYWNHSFVDFHILFRIYFRIWTFDGFQKLCVIQKWTFGGFFWYLDSFGKSLCWWNGKLIALVPKFYDIRRKSFYLAKAA